MTGLQKFVEQGADGGRPAHFKNWQKFLEGKGTP